MQLSVNDGKYVITFDPNTDVSKAYVQTVQQLEEIVRDTSQSGSLIRLVDEFPSKLSQHYGEWVMSGVDPDYSSPQNRIIREEKMNRMIPEDKDINLVDMCRYDLNQYVREYMKLTIDSTAKEYDEEAEQLMSGTGFGELETSEEQVSESRVHARVRNAMENGL